MAGISLQEYYEQTKGIIKEGRYAEAVSHGKHILKQYPKHIATYQLLGQAMLEADQDEYAADMFRRVLSADPEDLIAWIGMSEIYNQHGELDAAVWCLERAFELATDNTIVAEGLRQLYGQRDGVEPHRLQLTRGALARLYLKGDLLPRAISEFRDLTVEQPERVDLTVALAEALWRNEQRLEASEVCQALLDELPYCLKANLILGEIWTSSGREEGQMYLRRAEALDPENRVAQELFGDASPLLAREAEIVPLEYQPPTREERPDWMVEVEAVSAERPPLTEAEATLIDITAALETQIEIPSWLEEVEEESPAALPPPSAGVEPFAERPLEEAVPAPAEQAPGWLAGAGEESVEERPELVVEEEAPDWLTRLELEPTGEEEAPEWMTKIDVEAAGEQAAPSVPSAEQPPDWLANIREQFAEEEQAPEEAPAVAEGAPTPAWLEGEELPSGDEEVTWLEQLAEGKEEELTAQAQAEAEARIAEIVGYPTPAEPPTGETVETAPGEPVPAMPSPALAEIPDWLQELAPPEAAAIDVAQLAAEAAPEEAAPPPIEEAVAPPAEEAFGWTAFGEPEALPTTEAALEEAAAPPVEEAFGWTAFGEPEALPTAIAAIEEAPPVEEAPTAAEAVPTPAWLEGEELPSGDEALAWLEQLAEGKEEELAAQAQAEAEARMAEIMGRPTPAEPPTAETVEAAPEEPAPAMPSPAPAEIPDWLQELAPPEAAAIEVALEQAVAPPVEEAFGEPEAPPVEEAPTVAEAIPTPAWLEGEALPSGDEALAWLEQLAEGKEEELAAQARAEGEARMAEIMGRPTPTEPPTVEAPPEEAVAPPVEEAVAPPVEEAFGWTAFGEPEAPPTAVAAVEAVEEAPTVAEAVPTPAWLEGEALPSGDEALAWLEQLAEGKEEELAAQARAEGEARMAEIMGRPTPAEPPTVEAPPEEAVAPPIEEAVALPVEEAFGWTAFGEPEAPPTAVAAIEEAPPVEEAPTAAEAVPTPAWLEGEALPSGDEALAWLEQLAEGKEEELAAQARAEGEARMAEIMGRPTPAAPPTVEAPPEEAVAPPIKEAVAPPVEEAFGWTAFGEPEALPAVVEAVEAVEEAAPPEIPELAYVEEVEALPVVEFPVVEEAPPPEAVEAVEKEEEEEEEEAPPMEEIAPPEIPEPAYPEEVEAPPVVEFPAIEEMAPLAEEARWGAVLEAPLEKVMPAPVIEKVPGVVEMEIPEPAEEPEAVPEVPIVEAPKPFASERAYLKKNPRDYAAWLALARALWQTDEREEALEAYSRVIRAGKLLEGMIPDLEQYVEQWPDVSTQQVLGDAYMKDGRLQEALDIYRRALETL